MKKTLLLALALTSVTLAGCAEEAAESDTVIVDDAAPITEPADDMMMEDTTMMEGGAMEGGAMEGGSMEGGAMAPAEGGAMAPAAPMAGDSAATGTN